MLKEKYASMTLKWTLFKTPLKPCKKGWYCYFWEKCVHKDLEKMRQEICKKICWRKNVEKKFFGRGVFRLKKGGKGGTEKMDMWSKDKGWKNVLEKMSSTSIRKISSDRKQKNSKSTGDKKT